MRIHRVSGTTLTDDAAQQQRPERLQVWDITKRRETCWRVRVIVPWQIMSLGEEQEAIRRTE